MSEAELHVLRARLRGGILNKASRAALKLPLPMGLAYAEDETVILDPDAQIRASRWVAVRDLQTHRLGHRHREVFSHTSPALSPPGAYQPAQRRGQLGTAAPQHDAQSPSQSELSWSILRMARTRTTKQLDGSHHTQVVPQDQWQFLLRGAHVGSITWEEYEANLHQLQQNRPADARRSPARSCTGRPRLAKGDWSSVGAVGIG